MMRAVIFDVDGTLVDSVELHAKAWAEAFAQFGKRVSFSAVLAQIGKGGDQLMPAFLSQAELARFGKQLEAFRKDFFLRNELPRVQPLPRVRALFQALAERGVARVLATSGDAAQLQHHVELCNISELVDHAVTAEDTARTKPHPDVFVASLEKLGRPDPRTCIAVGDTPYDVVAAQRAGLATIGISAGGFDAEALRQAGAVEVYEDPGELLDRLDDSAILGGAEFARPGV